MIKLSISGKVHKVHSINKAGNYFKQAVVICQPEEEYRGKKVAAEYFVISIISNSENDSRFVKPDQVGQQKQVSVYLKGEHWLGNRGEDNYNHKLNLESWQ